MSGFRTGQFNKEAVVSALRALCPDEAHRSILDLEPEQLHAEGIRLLLLDVDNTLLPWKGEEFEEPVRAWIDRAKAVGMNLCVVSNTRHPDRLQRLTQVLGVEYVRGKFKPSSAMFLMAMEKFGATPEQTAMIGDQLFTDMLGANRSGVRTVLVEQMGDREFVGTRVVSRTLEKLVRPQLYKAIIEEDDDLPIVQPEGLFQSRLARQFAKFCIVGGTSFAIDFGLRFFIMKFIPWGDQKLSTVGGRWMLDHMGGLLSHISEPEKAFFYVAAVISGSVAIMNSFYWNRRWTFNIHGAEERGAQMRRFFALSIGVLILNALISGTLNNIIPGHPTRSMAVATFIATAVGAVCNFLGQRLWAFRRDAH